MPIPTVDVGDVLESRIVFDNDIYLGTVTLHYAVTQTALASVNLAEVSSNINLQTEAAIKLLIPTTVTVGGVGTKRLAPGAPTPHYGGLDPTYVGTATGDVMSRQTAGLVTKQTALAGPRYRGRMFMPFPSEIHNTNPGQPSTNYVGDLQALANILFNSITATGGGGTATLTPILWHRATSTITTIQTARANPYWGSQRRRNKHAYPPL